MFEGELEFHGGLALVAGLLAQANNRSDGVEEAPHTRGEGRIQAALEHGLKRGQFGGGKGAQRVEVVAGENAIAVHGVEQAQRAAAGLFDGLLAAGEAELTEVGEAVAL